MSRPVQYLLDAFAGLILGAAVCFLVIGVFQAPLFFGIGFGALVFTRVFASLVRSPQDAASTAFLPAPLKFEEQAELLPAQPAEALIPGSPVSALFKRAPTPGQMHEAIERHLGSRADDAPIAGVAPETPDAILELRQALNDLRRSAG